MNWNCTKCYHSGKECCRHRNIILTQGDISRIEAATKRRDFYHSRTPEARYTVLDPQDPKWHLYTVDADGKQTTLKVEPNGNCVFLSNTGCTLTEEVRPLLCRLHPYYFSESKMLPLDEDCPIAFMDDSQTILDRMNMPFVKAESWRKQLYEELRQWPARKEE